jgi:hypothetical protein
VNGIVDGPAVAPVLSAESIIDVSLAETGRISTFATWSLALFEVAITVEIDNEANHVWRRSSDRSSVSNNFTV